MKIHFTFYMKTRVSNKFSSMAMAFFSWKKYHLFKNQTFKKTTPSTENREDNVLETNVKETFWRVQFFITPQSITLKWPSMPCSLARGSLFTTHPTRFTRLSTQLDTGGKPITPDTNAQTFSHWNRSFQDGNQLQKRPWPVRWPSDRGGGGMKQILDIRVGSLHEQFSNAMWASVKCMRRMQGLPLVVGGEQGWHSGRAPWTLGSAQFVSGNGWSASVRIGVRRPAWVRLAAAVARLVLLVFGLVVVVVIIFLVVVVFLILLLQTKTKRRFLAPWTRLVSCYYGQILAKGSMALTSSSSSSSSSSLEESASDDAFSRSSSSSSSSSVSCGKKRDFQNGRQHEWMSEWMNEYHTWLTCCCEGRKRKHETNFTLTDFLAFAFGPPGFAGALLFWNIKGGKRSFTRARGRYEMKAWSSTSCSNVWRHWQNPTYLWIILFVSISLLWGQALWKEGNKSEVTISNIQK